MCGKLLHNQGHALQAQRGNFTMQQMAASFISGAVYKGMEADFLLPPSVGGIGQYLTSSFFGDFTVY